MGQNSGHRTHGPGLHFANPFPSVTITTQRPLRSLPMAISITKRISAPLVTVMCLTGFATGHAQQDSYSVVKLADGVYGLVWAEDVNPEPNVLIVVNDEDVLLTDSSMYPSTARTIVAEIRKITPKPVRYLVNTHWHDDHLFGNSVIQEAWPDVRIIAHPNTRIDATSRAFGSIPKDIENNQALVEKYRTMLETNKGPDGQPLTDERRKRVRRAIDVYTTYVREVQTVKMVLPNVTFEDELIIHSGSRTIELRYLGRGNTRGDVVVYLPKERILATGDLVVSPIPFGILSYYSDWIETLGKLQKLDVQTLFLAHGQIQHDWQYVGTLQSLLTDLVTRVTSEVKNGSTLEQIQKAVTLADWKKRLAGDDDELGRAFDAFFVQPAVERTYHQVKGDPDGT
jgi:glyoxylase-like metal-dependent hydrolase (beta-lactamase superfamily II)